MPPEAINLYGQMDNTCGLASLLMILQPESHGIAEYLARWWGGVKNVTKVAETPQVEFNWQRVLNYILLKALWHARLRPYALEKLGEFADDIYADYDFRIQEGFRSLLAREGPRGMFLKNSFESTGAVCDPLLQGHLNLMKKDSELKILYLFFGGKFHHHYDANQPTGAISFTREEVKNVTGKEFQKKINILEDAVKKNYKILLGLGHHWMVVKTIKSFEEIPPSNNEFKAIPRNYFFYVLDPEVKKEKTLPFKRIGENYLFYIFEQNETELNAGLQLLDEVLKEDLPKDAEVYRRFAANEVGAEESLKTQLAEFFGAWPLPEEVRGEAMENFEEGEEGEGERAADAAMLEAGGSETPKRLPTEEEMAQRLRAAIKKAFSDYSKV